MTTALQGILRCRVGWLCQPYVAEGVAGATYAKIGNCDSGLHRMFYNCLSTVACGPRGPTEDSGTAEGDVIDWKLYLL